MATKSFFSPLTFILEEKTILKLIKLSNEVFIPVCRLSYNYGNYIRVVASVWEFSRLRDMALKLRSV